MTKTQLDNKVAVITGAGRGIGLAIATLFAREGAQCALIVRDLAATKDAIQRIGDVAHAPVVAVADVSDETAVNKAQREISKRFPSIDILVNNAGILLDEDRATGAAQMEPQTLERTLAVNLFGAIHICRAFVPFMKRGGRVINVSSTMGQLSDGSAGYAPAYCISKTSLNAYTQALAESLAPRGIMVDCFHPGWARTKMGGSNATVDPMESAHVALFLATRPEGEESGKFWRQSGVIDW